jgi:hypothetical protein
MVLGTSPVARGDGGGAILIEKGDRDCILNATRLRDITAPGNLE